MYRISIHTPVKGVTTALSKDNGFLNHFNPHSREGSDLSLVMLITSFGGFQSTLP